jgi:MOSC domain-containing protein YiiM
LKELAALDTKEELSAGSVVSLQTGAPQTYNFDGRAWTTGMFKLPVEAPVHLTRIGFVGDGQADLEHHGGPDKAVCVYCIEHYPYWEQQLGIPLSNAAFGENITVSGLGEKKVSIGDVFRMGEALVQVSQPRQPCYKLGYKYGRADLPLLVQQTGYTGYYFRVLQEGIVKQGDTLKLVGFSTHRVSVDFANRIMHHDRENTDGTRLLLDIPELSESWRTQLLKRLDSNE